MYLPLLVTHSFLRWIVLAAFVVAIVAAFLGLAGKVKWQRAGRLVSTIAIGVLDLQFLIGLILYFLSPIVQTALKNFGAAMKQKELRFFVVEHGTAMLIALIVAHIGLRLAKKSLEDRARFARIAICYSIALAAILAGIPWWRPLLRL